MGKDITRMREWRDVVGIYENILEGKNIQMERKRERERWSVDAATKT